MSRATVKDFGPFLPIHNFIDQYKIPPSAKRLWAAVYGFYREHGVVYICREFFAKKLNLRKETISRALKALENIGVINRTGELKFGFYPCVELVALGDSNRDIESTDSQPVIKRSPPSDHLITDQRSFDHPKENKQEQIKEPNVSFLLKKNFSSNEKISLKQKLKAIGLHKYSIEKLISKFSLQKINTQIVHLKTLQERGDEIKKPVAWLIAAVEKNYELSSASTIQEQEEDRQSELTRQAAIHAQTAKNEILEGNHREARQIAIKSLEIMHRLAARVPLGVLISALYIADKSLFEGDVAISVNVMVALWSFDL